MLATLRKKLKEFLSGPLLQRRVVFGLVGAIGGFAYYSFIGCSSGTCPISSNPFLSTAYGALMGILVPVTKKPSEIVKKGDSA